LINADPVVQVTIANSLWMHLNTNPVLSSFVQTDQTYYGATIGDLSGAPGNVNVWISAETQGLIAQILPPGPASEYQRIIAVIANAVYFKGQWTTAFDASQTASAAFTLADGSQTQASLMHQSGSYPYLQGNWQGIAFQALRIPYGTGRLSMLIVLPAPGTSIGPFVASMTAAALAGWTAQLQIGAGSIALPRFSTAYGTSLVPALSVLGMGVAFCTSNAADFAALAPRTCLSDVEHKTVVEVDEAGTVAAAATTVTVSPTVVVASPPPFRMIMDHPFFYAVQDDLTGELLFIGILAQPSG
jgi:serpin B